MDREQMTAHLALHGWRCAMPIPGRGVGMGALVTDDQIGYVYNPITGVVSDHLRLNTGHPPWSVHHDWYWCEWRELTDEELVALFRQMRWNGVI